MISVYQSAFSQKEWENRKKDALLFKGNFLFPSVRRRHIHKRSRKMVWPEMYHHALIRDELFSLTSVEEHFVHWFTHRFKTFFFCQTQKCILLMLSFDSGTGGDEHMIRRLTNWNKLYYLMQSSDMICFLNGAWLNVVILFLWVDI